MASDIRSSEMECHQEL